MYSDKESTTDSQRVAVIQSKKMPPKVDISTFIGKRDNSIRTLYDLFEEFDEVYDIEPDLETLESVYKQVEAKYRNIRKQQESIADKIIELSLTQEDESFQENKSTGEKVKADYLKITRKYAAYKKKYNAVQETAQEDVLEAMSSAVKKMAESLTKPKQTSHGIEKLTVPSWDGNRRSYATWKHEFNHWMKKYSQDADEQLQRFRKALPRHSWWADQVKTCKTIDKAWKILDVEFSNERKLMDELLADINNHKPVRRDSKSLSRYAAVITTFINDMEDNGCLVTSSSEAPFVMSQLLSKLDLKDNTEFGREMYRERKDENVSNLIEWLQREATLRSRGKKEIDTESKSERSQQSSTSGRRSDNHSINTSSNEVTSDECPLSCKTKHSLAYCPTFQSLTVDQRWQTVKLYKRCRKCLNTHHTDDCKKADGTTCDKCSKRHHRSLHNEKTSTSSLNPKAVPFTNTKQYQADSHSIQDKSLTKNVIGLCPVQRIKIKDKEGNSVDALAMIDTGSNASFISKSTAQKIGLKGPQSRLTMNLAGGKKKSEDSELVEVTVTSPTDENVKKILKAYTIQQPCSPAKTISRKSVERYPHLEKISGDLYLSGGKIDILVGTNFVDAFVDIQVLTGSTGDPIAKKNLFGWYTLGEFQEQSLNSPRINSVDVETISALHDVKKLLSQDMLGVKPTELCTCTDNILKENKFVKSLEKSTQIIDGRVQVRMPWNDTGPPIRSNYDLALKRMYSSEKNFQKQDCFEVIEEEIQKLLDQEFVVEVPSDKVDHNEKEWYLPLQAVFTPERTTKVRLVFDASAKGHDGLSLNDHLEKGPNYFNSLPHVLMAWRWDTVAYSGDIRKMFNQITIHPDDQVFHRFLWRRNPNDQPTVYQWKRLNFGDKPAPDIATNSIQVLAKISQEEFPEAAKALHEHSYVDDIGGSRKDSSSIKKITSEIDEILSKGKFEIKEWHSNHKDVDQTSERYTSFLGHKWDKEKDTIMLKKEKVFTVTGNLTKRKCLACIAQLWDPIGLLTPISTKYRIDLQELWSLGYSWDDVLPDDIQTQWTENVLEMNELLNFEFNRALKPSNAIGQPQVHGFSDGGELAYGAVIFLRWELDDGKYYCVPVIVKSFVAPLKKKSIPRLELLGCLTLSRIYSTCKDALKFVKIDNCKKVFWVDALTVLSWIKNSPRKFKSFVSARVAEIQENMEIENFTYIKSQDNPADALTRGIHPDQFTKWLEGPSFLKLTENEWPNFQDATPQNDDITVTDEEIAKEIKSNEKLSIFSSHTETTANCYPNSSKTEEDDNEILNHLLKTCSSFSKVRKCLAYVLRFVKNTRSKIEDRSKETISVKELKDSEKLLFKWSQRKIDRNSLDKKLIAQADEDGIIRAHGRLENVKSLPDDLRNPIILPRKHQLVNLLLLHLHEKKAHCGYKSLMYEARRTFWIIGLRSTAKFLTGKCVTCRRLRKKPLEQLMGQLPSLRVAAGFPPFTHTAIDMFGPIQIKLNRRTLKEAQIAIFTCMTSRAVHLELCTDGSSDAFLMAFRRFASLRGHPHKCWSDCGTNFKGAQGYLSEVTKNWNVQEIGNKLAENFSCQFEWKWNIPKASHMNGVVESLIKSVRHAINATCRNQAFTEEQWRTFLAEISYMVNSRPLYPSSNGIWESPPITANDILLGQHHEPPQPLPEDKVNPRNLMRSTQNRISEFWNCWMKYFAPNLLPRNKWYRVRENLQIGDLVLQIDPKHRRTQWIMAIVVATYPGDDGFVRKVRIKTKTGEYDRPIGKLCLIATKEELEQ